jgi:hypothetical protein
MLHDLRYQWHSSFFELIVARLLQELGASLVFEGRNREGRRPGFTAQFSDLAVMVEATAPMFNAAAGKAQTTQIPLVDFIESKTPEG